MHDLDAIEDLAETDLPGALTAAAAFTPADPTQASRQQLLLGALTARSGDLGAALALLASAAATAQQAAAPILEAEALVTQASVHAALGDYDTALPLLRAQIHALRRLPGAEELLRDAEAELQAYETMRGG